MRIIVTDRQCLTDRQTFEGEMKDRITEATKIWQNNISCRIMSKIFWSCKVFTWAYIFKWPLIGINEHSRKNETLLWNGGRRNKKGWANGVCNRNDKIMSVDVGREREKNARVAPNAITRGASSRTEARWLHNVSRVFRRTLYRTRVISWQIDLSFVFDPRTASEEEKKPFILVYSITTTGLNHDPLYFLFWFMLTSSRPEDFFFLEEKTPWNQLRPAWWFEVLSWHPICTFSLTSWSVSKTNIKPANILAWPDCETNKPFKISMANISKASQIC